jgi:hypothetical protein
MPAQSSSFNNQTKQDPPTEVGDKKLSGHWPPASGRPTTAFDWS